MSLHQEVVKDHHDPQRRGGRQHGVALPVRRSHAQTAARAAPTHLPDHGFRTEVGNALGGCAHDPTVQKVRIGFLASPFFRMGYWTP